MRTLSEVNQRYKTQLDSLRTRLTAVTKEKCDNEDKVIKLSNELDRKVSVKQTSNLRICLGDWGTTLGIDIHWSLLKNQGLT